MFKIKDKIQLIDKVTDEKFLKKFKERSGYQYNGSSDYKKTLNKHFIFRVVDIEDYEDSWGAKVLVLDDGSRIWAPEAKLFSRKNKPNWL